MRVYIAVCVLGLVSVVALAQERPAPTADELEKAWISAVVLAAQSEQDAFEVVKATDAYKKYEARQKTRSTLQANATAKIEGRHPGFTIDWTKLAIVPKEKK